MKALSIREPWISKILSGEKTIETRTWITKHRGELLLVGSKTPKGPCSGKAVCVVILYDIKTMDETHEKAACCEVYDNAKSWFFRDLRKIKPIDVKGQLGLFNVDIEYKMEGL